MDISLLEGVENPSMELVDLELEVIKTDEQIDTDLRQRRQERRAAKAKKRKTSPRLMISLVALAAFVVALVAIIGGEGYRRMIYDYTAHYEAVEQVAPEGSVYRLTVEPETIVRSDPVRKIYQRTGYTGQTAAAGWAYDTYDAHTSLGSVRGSRELELMVSSIYRPEGSFIDAMGREDCGADAQYSGPYVGVAIENLDEAAWRSLPGAIGGDGDGVIWFSEKYTEIQTVEATASGPALEAVNP